VAKAVAERHGISTGLLFTWRKQMLAAAMSGFAAVQVIPDAPALEGLRSAEPEGPASEVTPPIIEVTFASGARLSMRGDVSPALLRELVEGLARR
jgi:transposase